MTVDKSTRNRAKRAFGQNYSEYYDVLYSDKDYESECNYIETLFRQFSQRKIRRVLDIACGTGGHAIPLAKRGYIVFATDLSKGMLAQARKKMVLAGVEDRVHLSKADMRFFRIAGKFDACLCMFAAIGYLSTYDDVLAAFRAMHGHLKPRAPLIFDFWNGIAVLTVGPSDRTKRARNANLTILRKASPKLDALRNLCKVKYELTVHRKGSPEKKFSETHTMRYFFPEEMALLLDSAGFELNSLHPFLHSKARIKTSDWNISAVARAT